MFEKTKAYRNMLKKNSLEKKLEEAKKEGNDWKVKQLENKLINFNKENYPNIFWDSSRGSYKKERKEI